MVGLSVLSVVPGVARQRLAVAAPVFGLIYLVLVLHVTTLVVPVSVGIWVAVAITVAIGAIAVAKGRFRGFEWARWARRFALVTAIGFGVATVAWLPSFILGTPLAVQRVGEFSSGEAITGHAGGLLTPNLNKEFMFRRNFEDDRSQSLFIILHFTFTSSSQPQLSRPLL